MIAAMTILGHITYPTARRAGLPLAALLLLSRL